MKCLNRMNASATALLIAALLSACGGGGGGSSSGAATPPSTTPSVPSGPGAPALSGDIATDGYNWFNYRRQAAGLSFLARDARIDAAAAGHSNYQRVNNTISHTQTPGTPGFTGADLAARLAGAGYAIVQPFAYGEVISAAANTSGFYHAEELIAAIYHRFVIFEPVFKNMGVGTAAGNGYTYFTTDFAASGGYGPGLGRGNVVVYPYASQTGVPLNFLSDSESPDPVPGQNEVGYPVSVHADISAVVTVQSFTIRQHGAGSDLSTRLLSHRTENETPASAAAIIPLAALKTNTVYDVSFAGTVDGVAVNRSWSFTTK